ncbi:MAG: hypothetical protein AB1801_29235, partial [Chloroflexota bacterium]
MIPLTPTPSPTFTVTPTQALILFVEPTATLTPLPGGRIVTLNPARSDAGWVVSQEEQQNYALQPNHFGDSFLYAGTAEQRVYYAAFQFNLDQIPRGSRLLAAELRLTGLRADQLAADGQGEWQVQLLSSASDDHWSSHSYSQIAQAGVGSTLSPVLRQTDLGVEQE